MTGWRTEFVGAAPWIAVDHMGAGAPVLLLHGTGRSIRRAQPARAKIISLRIWATVSPSSESGSATDSQPIRPMSA